MEKLCSLEVPRGECESGGSGVGSQVWAVVWAPEQDSRLVTLVDNTLHYWDLQVAGKSAKVCPHSTEFVYYITGTIHGLYKPSKSTIVCVDLLVFQMNYRRVHNLYRQPNTYACVFIYIIGFSPILYFTMIIYSKCPPPLQPSFRCSLILQGLDSQRPRTPHAV